jgi:flagellar biosynthesis anti-sigma factor FlgM
VPIYYIGVERWAKMRINTIVQPLNAELRKVENSRKLEKEIKTGKITNKDRSEFSSDAHHLNETKAQFETIATSLTSQSDVRSEKIAEVKLKIESGFYNSDEFIDKLADKLLKEFGIR